MKKSIFVIAILLVLIQVFSLGVSAQEVASTSNAVDGIQAVQQYGFSIGILAMLLLGFGFLMVFVKNYGFSALTGTYILVATVLPLYLFLRSTGILSAEAFSADTVKALLFAEFAAAAALISMGAVLGRFKIYQYSLLGLLIVPFYMINEHLVLEGGLAITKGFTDAAGSITIHAFGAYFGIGLTLALANMKNSNKPITSSFTSDRFSMIGSMLLWIFWPSFCSAIVPQAQFQQTVINTILALSGATLATYFMSLITRKGKVLMADIANASLAGGVAVGATCNLLSPAQAFGLGVFAGALCVIGYAFIQPVLQEKFKIVDTCGVHNLHGMPGLFGGLVAIFFVTNATAQLVGILLTVIIALIGGILSGFIIRLTGSKQNPYEDNEEFIEE